MIGKRFVQARRRFSTNWSVSRPKCMLRCFYAPADSRACRPHVSDCALVRAAIETRGAVGPRERGARRTCKSSTGLERGPRTPAERADYSNAFVLELCVHEDPR